MLKADRNLVGGNYPLTESMATAYGELLAYAELLQYNSKADPNKISQHTVEETKTKLIDAWAGFSVVEQEQVQELPAVWTALRRVIGHGNESDRESVRGIIRQITPQEQQGASQTEPSSAFSETTSWISHQMQMQTQTFNHYRWCRGYTSTIFGF